LQNVSNNSQFASVQMLGGVNIARKDHKGK
jgi:hypothetical protein